MITKPIKTKEALRVSIFTALTIAVVLPALVLAQGQGAAVQPSNVLQEVNCFDFYRASATGVASGGGNATEPKLQFVSIANYPLMVGAGNRAVACFSNENGKRVEDVRLQLSVLDASGKSLFSGFERGAVDAAYKGVIGSFASSQSLDTFSVKAELYQGNKLVDHATVNYGKAAPSASLAPIVVIVLILIALAVLVLRLILGKRKKVLENDNPLK